MSNIEYQTQSHIQIECRISNIKLNLTFKFWMSNIKYQTESNIPIIWILNIKLNPTVEFWMSNIEYRITQFNIWLFFLFRTSYISNWIKHSDLKSQKDKSRVSNIKLNPTFKFWIDCYIVPFVKHCSSMRQGWWFTFLSLDYRAHFKRQALIGWLVPDAYL